MNIESFSGSDRFGTKESRDAIDPADEKRLRNFLSTAMAKANAILKKNPNDVRALYALGNSNVTLAAFEGTAKRAYLTAHGYAKEARKRHQQVLKLDPAFNDARLSIGVYDYVTSAIPWLFRKMLFISGGDKAAGIREIETVAVKGKLASTDAKMLLVAIYNREAKFDQSIRLLNELHGKYPRNFVFELAKASVYGKMKRWDDAARVYEHVLEKIRAGRDGYGRLRDEKVYFQLGDSNVHRYQFERAVDAFSRVIAGPDATPDEKATAHLWIGKISDTKKDRTKAIQHYDAVLRLNCDSGLQDEARRYKRRPFGA
jgi:tetratricopeptide (TPR) repeat protein